MKILSALAALLTACGSPKPPAPRPEKPGTSLQLAYPVLLISKLSPDINVFATEEDLTTTQVSAGRAYTEQKVIDSNGDLYAVKKDTAIGGVPSVWRDMGTSRYRVFLEMKLVKRVNLEQVRNMVLEQVRSPRNETSRPPERLRTVEGHIQSYRTLQELIAGCTKPWEWMD